MATIILKTTVKGNYLRVIEQFDRKLFEALAPRQGKMEVVEFTGSKKGDRVHVRFISPFKADWVSKITDDYQDSRRAYFVDEGDVMPFGLAFWEHQHIVEKLDEDTCQIIDHIRYKGKNTLITLVLYPLFYFGFRPRKNIYQSFFGRP